MTLQNQSCSRLRHHEDKCQMLEMEKLNRITPSYCSGYYRGRCGRYPKGTHSTSKAVQRFSLELTHACLKTKKELTASMVTSLVSWSFPRLPQSHLGGHVAFVRVVYFPPNRACAHARPHIRPTNWLPSLSSHTYYYRRPEPMGTKVAIAKKVQTGCTAIES